MRRFCKRTSALALATLLAASVSSCSSGTGGQAMVTPDTAAQAGVFNEESKTEESKSAGEPVTIRPAHYAGEQVKRDVLDVMLAAFSEAHPEIRVDMEVVVPSFYIATYKSYIAAGEAPDTMFGKPQIMQELANGGYSMDLRDEVCMANVLPMPVDERTVNGGVCGPPIDAQVKATFCNKKMFQEARVEVPVTKDELLKVRSTFMDQEVYSFVHPYSLIHGVLHELDPFLTSMTAAADNENVWMDSQNDVRDPSGSPAIVEAMEIFSKSALYKDAGDTAADQIRDIQNFAADQRSMYMSGGRLMGGMITVSPGREFGMFPTPRSDNPEENKLWIGIDDVLVVSQRMEYGDEVMTLLNFFANGESSRTWISTAKLMADNTTIPTDDADASIKEIKSYIDNGMIVSKNLVPDYTSEYSVAFRAKLQEFVTLNGSQRDATKLLKDVNDEIASIRQQFLRYI